MMEMKDKTSHFTSRVTRLRSIRTDEDEHLFWTIIWTLLISIIIYKKCKAAIRREKPGRCNSEIIVTIILPSVVNRARRPFH
jgi:hypothetical protein